MYDSLVAARPSRPHRLPAGLRRHLLQHSLTRHSLCCYTKARDRSNVVNPAVNTHHGGVLSHTVAGCLIFFLVFFFFSRRQTYSSSSAGRGRRPGRGRRGSATVRRLRSSTRSSELSGNPPWWVRGIRVTDTGHCSLLWMDSSAGTAR